MWWNILVRASLLFLLIGVYDLMGATRKASTKRATTKSRIKNKNLEMNKFLTDEDFRTAASLKEKSVKEDSNMYGVGTTPENISLGLGKRSMVRDRKRLWPNATVPYELGGVFDKRHRAGIAKAILIFRNVTCIRFVPRQAEDRDYLFIAGRGGCGTVIGRLGGKQWLYLDINFYPNVGEVLHKLMHVLGFYDEHRRYDRDKYINIFPENLYPSSLADEMFYKKTEKDMDTQGEEYDYESIMHIPSVIKWSRRKQPIVKKKDGGWIIRRHSLNQNDIRKVNKLYKCPQKG